ncbi:hypothetical protein O181_051159 [Austropuccinia psidii MF-1]|uniref:Shugoshin C-terminal domain-containing protein n=1 Tax=Austropuccinia psidii MF-1 TaxID=1389203 RepID=A0A9Q3DY50_9BASI|nr:hypothetical protein [Austropuccinia psidii MF-1]
MPATRSSGPPTAASLQPILMEALENFKQKHSKQNQDLIHKNRFLLKTTAELERTNKDLKNENLELRILARKAQAAALEWRQRAEGVHQSSNPIKSDDRERVRLALADIANRCKSLEASLSQPKESTSSASIANSQYPNRSFPSTVDLFTSSSLLTAKGRAELLALRERRRSQLPIDAEESRLSFINECSGNEDRSESTLLLETRQVESPINTRLQASIDHPDSSAFTSLLSDSTCVKSHKGFPLDPSPNEIIVSGSNHPRPLNGVSVELSNSNSQSNAFIDDDEKMANYRSQNNVKDRSRTTDYGKWDEQNEKEVDQGRDERELEEEDHDEDEEQDEQLTNSHFIDVRKYSGSTRPTHTCQYDRSPSPSSSSSLNESPEPQRGNKIRANDGCESHAKKLAILRQRRSKKQRRASLTPTGILETVNPAAFSLLSFNRTESTNFNESLGCRKGGKNEMPKANSLETELSVTESAIPSMSHHSYLKRRDSGLTKNEVVDEQESEPASKDEGWEKRPAAKKKRARAELDAVTEEQPMSSTHQPENEPKPLQLDTNLSGLGPREARRVRKEVNYALPSLSKKMRRPDSHGPPTKRPSNTIRHSQGSLNTKKTKLVKSSGATPSTVASNTSASTNTTLTLSSPTSSSSSSSLILPSKPQMTEPGITLNEWDEKGNGQKTKSDSRGDKKVNKPKSSEEPLKSVSINYLDFNLPNSCNNSSIRRRSHFH